MQRDNLYYYLLLAFTPYIGPISFASLMQRFGNAKNVFMASADELRPCLERPDQALDALLKKEAEKTVEESLTWLEKNKNCRLMTLLDDDYPLVLAQGMAPPPVLFLRGKFELLQQNMIAIVGSRHATVQGTKIATSFAKEIASQNWTVVSGFADGIDSAAHRGALNETGSTIAILGTGIDRVYPAKNRDLAHEMVQKGLLISEFPLETAPLAVNFPRRNRLIAALGRATVVIEATEKSGSLITARLAGEMGRDVMAVPGSIFNVQATGCHKLIRDGATLVTCTKDILSEYEKIYKKQIEKKSFRQTKTNTIPNDDSKNKSSQQTTDDSPLQNSNLSATAQSSGTTQHQETLDLNPQKQEDAHRVALLSAMGFDAVHPDDLAQQLLWHPADIYAILLDLELEGMIMTTSGGRYQRIR
ncbi:MAG: DNA-processing protein DprA [Neisseriaceae bacterium]|nr:DNA-processing protein DprA [Neisseriaceae bacterium]